MILKFKKKEEPRSSDSPIMETRSDNGNWVTDISGGLFGPKKRTWQVQVGVIRTITTDYFERELKIYNDNSIEEGPWRKIDTQKRIETIRF